MAGAGIAFALQEVIASVAGWGAVSFGGFYSPGDRVQLGGIKGDVIDIGVLRTTIMECGQWVAGDAYNGRIVRVANSFVFKEPVFNYSADFPFLWDEIVIPVKYGSDRTLAREIFLGAAQEVVGKYTEFALASWKVLVKIQRMIVPASRSQRCYNCLPPFEISVAVWCGCIARFRTLCCPACLQCFCHAPRSYKNEFWLRAPLRLLEWKRAERLADDVIFENPNPLALARPLVLIAENEMRVHRFAAGAIGALGYGVVHARRGDEALDLIGPYAPDLVLTRALLPKLDGRVLCKTIKDNPATAKIPVVVMTPLYTASRYRYEALGEFGVDDYLSMPVSFATLREVLEKRLAGVPRAAAPGTP